MSSIEFDKHGSVYRVEHNITGNGPFNPGFWKLVKQGKLKDEEASALLRKLYYIEDHIFNFRDRPSPIDEWDICSPPSDARFGCETENGLIEYFTIEALCALLDIGFDIKRYDDVDYAIGRHRFGQVMFIPKEN